MVQLWQEQWHPRDQRLLRQRAVLSPLYERPTAARAPHYESATEEAQPTTFTGCQAAGRGSGGEESGCIIHAGRDELLRQFFTP